MSNPETIIQRLFRYAEEAPNHDAIVTSTFTLSYAELAQAVVAQALELENRGLVASGESSLVVGIRCANDPQHLVLCLAVIYLGATSCTIPSYESDEAQQRAIQHVGVTVVLDEQVLVSLPTVCSSATGLGTPTTPLEEVFTAGPLGARLFFSTSGTTGKPKLVVHYDCDLVAQAHRHVNSWDERFVCLASMEHNFSKRHRLYCVAQGATNVFLSDTKQELVAECQSLAVNVMHVSAFQAQELLALAGVEALSHLRLKLGGSHVPLSLRQQLRTHITENLQAGYGTTETGAIAFTDPSDSQADESVGRPLPGIDVRVVTPERECIDHGKRGEIAIRCEGMFRGYHGKADLTHKRLENGWFYTGDIGYLDQQQRIHLCGRSDDMFVFNSMNIYPQDIESVLCKFPHVTDAAVLPRASSIHGNIPVALVAFANDKKPDFSGLKKFAQQQLGVRCPRQFTLVDKIPRNASGKIIRCDVEAISSEIQEIRSTVIRVLQEHVVPPIKPALAADFERGEKDIPLRKIAMDSLARMELLVALEVKHGVLIRPQEFSGFRSLGHIVTRALSLLSEQKNLGSSVAKNVQTTNGQNLSQIEKFNSDLYPPKPQVVKLFQRIFSFCASATQLNHVFSLLEYRLTPLELTALCEWHDRQQLIFPSAEEKYHTAATQWLSDMQRKVRSSGKSQPEPFVSRRVSPYVTHFVGPGSAADKTLLVCFAAGGKYDLLIPNTLLLQFTDATKYDVLMVAEPRNQGYKGGVPFIGDNVMEMMAWLSQLSIMANYRNIRTVGASAGGYIAVVAGYHLDAEMAVSISGRFHRLKRHPVQVIDRLMLIWRAKRSGHCSKVLLSYCAKNSRDRRYAQTVAKVTGGTRIAVAHQNKKIGHVFLQRLLEYGELKTFLADTLFIDTKERGKEPQSDIVSLIFPLR